MATKTKTSEVKSEVKSITLRQEVQDILDSLPSKSAKVRFLDAVGLTRGDISKVLNIRYQHVRNVLITPVKTDNSKELAAKVK